MDDFDIEFFFDPVCPFAWITSRWIVKVQEQTGYTVNWRFISLRFLNKDKNYETEMSPQYQHSHPAGLRMLRVAAAVREDLGPDPIGPLYGAFAAPEFDADPNDDFRSGLGTDEKIERALANVDLPTEYAGAAHDDSWDTIIEAETEMALERTGRDVGTPIITFRPPDGLSFFGPVISRIPEDEDAVPLWNAVTMLAAYPGFAEMKRSLRERPQLRVFGELTDNPDFQDWRRLRA